MSLIIGVHGIAQQQLGRQQLLATWRPALGDGVERACGRSVQAVPLDIAFFADVFLASSDLVAKSRPSSSTDTWWEDLDAADLADLEEAAHEVLPADAVTEAETKLPMARTRMPGFLRAIDRLFPAGGLLAFGDLVQVRRYLKDSEVKMQVDDRVQKAVSDECRVLIGHSLGSVVAFEYLRQHPDIQLRLLVTLGSPLGLQLVRRLMPDPRYGADDIPAQLGAWVSVRDAHDPVACAGPLRRWWPGVMDAPLVDNGPDAHSVTAYLGKRVTGQAVLEALQDAEDIST